MAKEENFDSLWGGEDGTVPVQDYGLLKREERKNWVLS